MSIAPGCVQFLGVEKRFHTAWVKTGPDGPEIRLPLFPQKRTQVGHRAMSGSCQFQTFGGSCGSTNLDHPQVISCAGLAEWNAGDYHD